MIVAQRPVKTCKNKHIYLFINPFIDFSCQDSYLNLKLVLWVFLPAGYLQWDIKNSVLGGVRYFNQTLLTVEQPGYYLVYSRVTFSKAAARSPLKGEVKLRKDDKKEEVKTLMRAYCNLDGATRTMCTASQEEVVRLERGNQLGVWVEDLSLVNYDEAATTFGMYKLEGEPLRAAGR